MNHQDSSHRGDILVVDDTQANLAILVELLGEREGYKVRPASSGQAALDAVAAQAPDLILLDIKMPGMDGYEVCRQLKSNAKTRDIPVIFISALDSAPDQVQGFELGGVDFITKPFEAPVVLARVRTHLALSRTRRELGEERNLLEIRVRERTEALEQANRTQQILLAVNQVLVKASSEAQIVEDICRLLVELADYELAWIAYLEHDQNNRVRLVAQSGKNPEFIRSMNASWNDTPERPLVVAEALASGRPTISRGVGAHAMCSVCQATEQGCGGLGSICLPLLYRERTLGVLTVCSAKGDGFGADEAALLQEISGDLALGIEHQRIRHGLEQRVAQRTRELEQANERLKELDRLKSMFIATMSHELRTPLNAIIGFSSLLLQGNSGELNEKQRANLNRVHRAGRHLLNLITDIIDISKIESGRMDVEPETFSLRTLVEEATQTVQPEMERKDLALAIEADEWPDLYTDRKRLLQCLLNLLSNAEKYTEEGEVAVRVSSAGDEVHIAVKDTGIGIAEDDMSKLFEAFERLSSPMKVKAGGTGLGLYLTKKIAVTLLKGRLLVESEPGAGSLFTLCIPRKLPQLQV